MSGRNNFAIRCHIEHVFVDVLRRIALVSDDCYGVRHRERSQEAISIHWMG